MDFLLCQTLTALSRCLKVDVTDRNSLPHLRCYRAGHATMAGPHRQGGIMEGKMTPAARAELADAIRGRYIAASNKEKGRILEEFIAATGYHEKSAIRVLNTTPAPKRHHTRRRPSLYDEAVRGALIVLWEASDRVCGKRLKALPPILLPALERNGHLSLDQDLRQKILSMSAATIDRLLRTPRSVTQTKKAPRTVPEPRRRIKLRTFADWNDPSPGSMEMDLVAHCGAVNRGSYVHSLVLTVSVRRPPS